MTHQQKCEQEVKEYKAFLEEKDRDANKLMNYAESNKLIAEFMGSNIYPEEGWMPPAMKLSGFEYHSNWQWLMPVVEKISRIPLPYKEDDGRQDTHWPRTFGMLDEWDNPMFRFNCGKLFTGETLIEATYNAVVDFIQWYNEKKQP